jgi:hypothetical protein
MRIRKRNRILRRLVLGTAVVAVVVPGAANAKVDEGLGAASAVDSYIPFVTDFPQSEQTSSVQAQGGVRLADPKYGQENSVQVQGVRLADPKYGQENVTARPVELRDFPQSLQRVELGTYGMPAAGRNVYLETHSGKALVNGDETSTPASQVVSSGSFDWSDAGIGAGIFAALIVVIGGAAAAARQLGRPQTA